MKKGNIMRDVISSSQFTANVIKEYKKGLGDVVLVAITPRTTIELPAHLTQAEIDARIEIYKKLHSSKVWLSLKPWGIALKFLFLHHENILFPND